jgi:hypothetical protein
MGILDKLKENLKKMYYSLTLREAEEAMKKNLREDLKVPSNSKIESKLSLSERLEKIYEQIGISYKKIDEEIFSLSGFTPEALSLYEKLKESYEKVKKIRFPAKAEEYEELSKFSKIYQELKKKVGKVGSHSKDLEFASTLGKTTKILISSHIFNTLPKYIKNQAGIEIIGVYLSSPVESVKIYEVAGKRPPFNKLSESLKELGLKLEKVTKDSDLGEIAFFLSPFIASGEEVLKAIPFVYFNDIKLPTIYFCRGPRCYAEGGIFYFLLEPPNQTIGEFVYTENFPVYIYDFEGELIEKIRDLFMESSMKVEKSEFKAK